MSVSSWILGPAHTPDMAPHGSESHAGMIQQARQGEEMVDLVEALTERLRGTPARPGVRPVFIPSAAVVVDGRSVHVSGLSRALSGRAGSIVAWVP